MADVSIKFELDELESNPNSRIVISYPRTTDAGSRPIAVVGFVQSSMSIGVSADHNTPFESSAQESLSSSISKFQSLLSASGFKDQSAVTLKTFAQTVNSWNGSSKPKFTQEITFIRTREDYSNSTLLRAGYLYETVLPANRNFLFAGTMQPPLNYLPVFGKDNSEKVRGTMTVAIGNWFLARNQVMTDVTFTFSKECVEDGTPLVASGSVSFEPYRMPSLDEFMGYFNSFVSSES